MIRRIDQQIRVNKLMIDAIAGRKDIGKNIRRYMLRYLENYHDSFLDYADPLRYTGKSGEEKRTLEVSEECRYPYLQKNAYGNFRKRRKPSGGSGRNISVAIYKLAQKFYGFN